MNININTGNSNKTNTCPQCGANLKNHKCEYCGYEDAQAHGFTETINNLFNTTATKIENTVSPNGEKSRVMAFLLCLLFGYFGAHRMYLKRWGSGFLFLLTYGLFGIGWLVDLVRILTGSLTDGDGNPLKKGL